MPELTRKPKLVIFDLDKTLTFHTSWYELTKALKADVGEHARIYVSFQSGAISFQEAKKQLFSVWTKHYKKITKEILKEILLSIELRGEAIATVGDLQKAGYQLAIISSSVDQVVKFVADRLGIDDWYSNSVMIFDEQNCWIDLEYQKDEEEQKIKQLEELLRKKKLTREQVLAIGDGKSDRGLFRVIPGIAVHSDDDHLRQLAWKEVKYLPRILQLVESLPE